MVNAIGIDLGTSKCCVGVFRDGKVDIIPDKFGNKTVSSSVFFAYNGLVFDNSGINVKPGNTIFAVLRLLGRKFDNPVVQSIKKYLPFSLFTGSNGRFVIGVGDRHVNARFYPEEIVAMLLVRLKQSADAFLEADVKDVVITTSGQLGLRFRRAIFDAAEIAGLNVLRIINASTATAIAHFFGKFPVSGSRDAIGIDATLAPAASARLAQKKALGKWNTLIFDFGAGALDVSVVSVKDGQWKVLSTVSDDQIGGEDIKNRLYDYFEAELKRKYMISDRQFEYCLQTRERFLATSERVKHKLSIESETVASFGILFGKTENFKVTINRSFYERLCFDLFRSILKVVRGALLQARMEHNVIDEVVLLGGHIHTVERMISEMFPGKDITKFANPEQAAAAGASIRAAMFSGHEFEAGKTVLTQEVLQISLGVCCTGQTYMCPILKRGTAIPAKKTDTVTVKYDDNNEISIKVYEGDEYEPTKDVNFLCELKLNGIPLLSNHYAAIQVTFEVDANGTLTVSVHDNATDKSGSAAFPNEDSCFSEQETKVMLATHQKFMHDIQLKRKRITAMSGLETMITTIEANKRKRKLEEQAENDVYKQVKKTFNWLEGNEVPKSDEFGRRLKLAEDLNKSFGSQFSSGG